MSFLPEIKTRHLIFGLRGTVKECKIVEYAPSNDYVKIEYLDGSAEWRKTFNFKVIESLIEKPKLPPFTADGKLRPESKVSLKKELQTLSVYINALITNKVLPDEDGKNLFIHIKSIIDYYNL